MSEGCGRCPHMMCRLDAVRRPEPYMDGVESATSSYTPVLRMYCTHRETVERASLAGVPTRREFVTEFRSGVDQIVDAFDTVLIAEHHEAVSTADVPDAPPPDWCCSGISAEAGS